MAGPNELFDNFNNFDEQFLHDGIIQDCIEIYGEGMYYMPRRTGNLDRLYTEDDQDYYDTVYLSTFYIKNVDGFEGQGNFMSKFGLEIRDQITLVVSNTIFMEDVGTAEEISRPREGDLIYFPLADKVFEIVFVNKFTMYFPFGASPSYNITCQLFEYSGQRFTTGVPAVDKVGDLTEDLYQWALLDENGQPLVNENGDILVVPDYSETGIDPLDQSTTIEEIGDSIIDFSESDPFSAGEY